MDTGTSAKEVDDSGRYERLQKCFLNFVRSHREKNGSCKRMAKSFPQLFKQNPEALKLISDAFCDRYTSMLEESLKDLLKTCSIKERLDELEECVEDGEDGWRPSGDPEKDLRAHIALTEHAEVLKLQAELKKEDVDIAALRDTLNHKDKAIERKLLHVHALAEECTSPGQLAQANMENLHLLLKNGRKFD